MSSHTANTGNPGKANTALATMKQKALLLIQQQNFDGARITLENACKKYPRDAESWFMLGAIYGQLEDFPQAERCCRKAILLAPDHPGLHHNLSIALLKQDKREDAIKHLQTAVKINPGFAEAYHDLGNALQANKEYPAAVAAYRKAIRLQPGIAALHFNLGNALRDQALIDEAIPCYEKAIEIKPDFSEAYSKLAALLIVRFKFTQTVRLLEKAVKLLPEAYDLHFKLGATYQKLGDIDKSIPCYRKTLDIHPSHEDAKTGIAIAHGLQANYDAAYKILRPLIDTGDYHGATLVTFAHFSHHFKCENEAISLIKQYLLKPSITKETRKNLLFAMARLQERMKQFDDAFNNYHEANRTTGISLDRKEYANALDRLCTTYSKSAFQDLPQGRPETGAPVFIVGMPRSGTSLVEQILASHPDVFGAGELNFIISIIAEIPKRFGLRSSYPECIREMTPSQLEEIAGEYMDDINMRSNGESVVIDKMPNNFIHLGFINLLFPKARIIYCTRNPMDNCLSCYFQNFSGSHPYAHDLEDLGFYYREHQRIMRHWGNVIQLPLIEVKYEDMVLNHEAVSRALIDFCGLTWDERCLDFHKTDRTVATASNEQVRSPIYTSSIERWKTYAAYLPPLQTALETSDDGRDDQPAPNTILPPIS